MAMQRPTCKNLRIRSTHDAHLIFYAVQLGMLPMVTRRLDADERSALKSGCVYVWEERGPHSEVTGLGIERFTEGRRWGPSRVRDEFLFYYERPKIDDPNRQDQGEGQNPRNWDQFVKQTYSVWVDCPAGRRKWHLTAYFTQTTIDRLDTLADMPEVVNLRIPEGLFITTRTAKGRKGEIDPRLAGSSSGSRPSNDIYRQNVARTYAPYVAPYSTTSPSHTPAYVGSSVPYPPHGDPRDHHGYGPPPTLYGDSALLQHPLPHYGPHPQPVHDFHGSVEPQCRPDDGRSPTYSPRHLHLHSNSHPQPPSRPAYTPHNEYYRGVTVRTDLDNLTHTSGRSSYPSPPPRSGDSPQSIHSHYQLTSSRPVSSISGEGSYHPSPVSSHSYSYPSPSPLQSALFPERAEHPDSYPLRPSYPSPSSPPSPPPTSPHTQHRTSSSPSPSPPPQLPPLLLYLSPSTAARAPLADEQGDSGNGERLHLAPLREMRRSHPYRRNSLDDKALRLLGALTQN